MSDFSKESPESTLESANRRTFIRKAALVTAGIGVAGATLDRKLIGKNLLPESSAKSGACPDVTTSTSPNTKGNLAVWNCNASITDSPVLTTGANLTGRIAGCYSHCSSKIATGVLNVHNTTCTSAPCANKNPIAIVATTEAFCYPGYTTRSVGVLALSKKGCGIFGFSYCGVGVYGRGAVGGWGVQGCTCSSSGYGVAGYANTTSGCNIGVFGRSCSSSGQGVQGYAAATSGCNIGVLGVSSSPDGQGVQGYANSTGGSTIGVYGVAKSPCGTGVWGWASGTSGHNKAVFGQSCSSCGTAIEGLAGNAGTVPLVARGNSAQTANLQQWQKGCTVVSVVNKCGWVGVGTPTPSTPLDVIGSATIVAGAPASVPLVTKGTSGQTANLQEWVNNAGCVFAVINAAGSLGLGGVTKPSHVLCVSGKAHASNAFGIATNCINTTLAVHGSVSTKARVVSSTTTMTTTDFAILANATTAAFSVTLPAAGTPGSCNGMIVFVKKTDSTSNGITVAPASGDNIEGNTTGIVLGKQYDSLQLISNGAHEWFILGSSKCGGFIS